MGAAAMWPVTPAGFDQTGMNFDASVFAPMQWMEPSMGAVECHGSDSSVAEPEEWRSTVMIRNMPNNYTREMLLELVDLMGFAGTYDFVYLPIDFQSQAGLGYAFINFASVADALRCFDRFEGFSDWKVPSEKVCTITWSSPTQGLEAHLERYRNSPVMHHSLADDWKPVLFQMGRRVAFPPPTKPIKTPKVRQQAPKAGFA
jgi:RNA recognition motif-containing protein